MLEIPGILFTLVASLCYTKYLSENRMNESWWRRTCLASTLLFFCKYNYLIIWIISLVTFELITNEKFRQDTTHFSKRILSSFDKRSPFCWISLCYFLLLSFVALFGGIDTVFLGHRLVFKSILGNPIYGFMLFAAIYHLIFHRERFKLAWLAFINAPEPYRSANRLFIVPVLIWFAYPPNFSTFLSFLVNQSKRDSFFSLKTLVFYPTYFISEVSFNGIVGTIVLGGFFAGFLWLRKFSLPERFIFWLAMLGYSFCVIHPNYIDRYLLTTVPFIFISASLSILRMSRSIFSESSIGPISLLVCLLSVIFVEHNASYQNQFVLRETRSKEIFHLIDPICKKAMESSPTNVVGFNSEMSPDLVAWRCLTLYPDIPMIALPKTINRISGLSYQTSPEDILASKKVANFAVISYDQPQQNDPSFIYRKSEYLELKDMLSKSSHVKLGEYYFVTSLEQHVQFYHRVQ